MTTNDPIKADAPEGVGVPASPSGHSPQGLSRDASQAKPSVPNAVRVWLSSKQVAGTLAMWAIRQSPYPCPDNLAEVVDAFAALWPSPEPFGLSEWSSIEEIEAALQAVFAEIPALLAWNERKNGNKSPFGFVSLYDRPDPDDDFIDLGALWGNVARSLWAEEIAEEIAMPPEGTRREGGSGPSGLPSASGTDRPNDTTEAP